jgi:ABC-type Na+ efflux pump permease subunit/membrane protease YdiL (CAAX protease family)
MKRYRRVWTVYRKEFIETLRDRRTLIAMVVVPIVLYPVLMIVLVEALRTEKGRRQAERYSVRTASDAQKNLLESMLKRENAERKADEKAWHREMKKAGEKVDESAGTLDARIPTDQIDITVVESGEDLWKSVQEQKCQAAVLISSPTGGNSHEQAANRIVQIIYRDTDPRSEFVQLQLSRILANESDRILRERVARLPGGVSNLTPILASSVSTSSPQQQFAKILAMIVPFLLVIMSVTGAMYPAIDLTAGERERGTLETLAVSPVPVGQLIAGKFGVIISIAMISTALNLGSMTAMVHFSKLDQLTMHEPARQAQALSVESTIREAPSSGDETARAQQENLERRRALEGTEKDQMGFVIKAAPIVLLAMIPFAVLASAVMLAACSFARTFKEAQNYMMPVMTGAIIPAMIVSYMPTIRLEGMILVLPVANVVVLIRELFLGNYHPWGMTICLLSTCLYATAAVAVAAKLYGNEAVLFSDIGSYKTLLRRRFIRPQALPSSALALLSLALLFPANFYLQSYFVDPHSTASQFRWVMAASQLLAIGLPCLLLAWYFKLRFETTFSLRVPSAPATIAALLIAGSVVPIGMLMRDLQAFCFPSLSGGDESLAFQEQLITSGSFAGIVAVFAVLPGICEEIMFRGMLLAGLRAKLSPMALVAAVGIIFGVFHIHAEKIALVSLTGALLAYVCVASGSIFPGILIHIANNGLLLAAARFDAVREALALSSETKTGTIHFTSRTACYVMAFVLGLILLELSRRRKNSI